MRLIVSWFMLTSLIGCGSMTVKGRTNHETRSVVEGETIHTVKLDFDSLKELCAGQPDEVDCIRTVIDSLDSLINMQEGGE